MKRITKISLFLIIVAFFASNVNAQEHQHAKHQQMMKMHVEKMDKNHDGTVYQCTMCPDQISDKPGDCPKCGMHLTQTSVNDAQKLLDDYSNDDAYVPGSETAQEHAMHSKKHMNMKAEMFDKNKDGVLYQCSNCPMQISDKSGKCPKCGKTMSKVSVDEAQRILDELSNDDAYVPGTEMPNEHLQHNKADCGNDNSCNDCKK